MPDPQPTDHARNFSGIATGVTMIRKISLLGFFILMHGTISLQPISLHAQSANSEKPPIFILPGTPIPVELTEAFLSNENNVEQTLELLDRLEKENPKSKTALQMYRAIFLKQKDRTTEALSILEEMEAADSSETWKHRVRFERAEILIELGRFGEAQRIIESETKRLHSNERRKELALILIKVGDKLSEEPDPNQINPTPKSLDKAHQVYSQAADLLPPTEVLERAMSNMVRCSEEQNSRNLFSDCKRYLENFDYKNAPWDEGNGENYVGKSLLSVLLAQTKSMPKREKRQALNDLIQRIDSEIIDHPWLARFFANQSKDSVSKTRNECLRRIISTYNTPDLILTAMKRFVATATDHEEYWEIDFQIGNILLQEQLTEDALQHWIGFLGRVPNSLSKNPENLPAKAQYKIGRILWTLEKYDEAIAALKKYGADYPDGPDWAAAQDNIIQIESEFCERLYRNKSFEECRASIVKFSQKYPIDHRTLPLLKLSAMSFSAQAEERLTGLTIDQLTDSTTVQQLYESCISELRKIHGKYPKSILGQEALFTIGNILEQNLLKPEEAVVAYRDCFGGVREFDARLRLEALTQVSIAVETKKLHRSSEAAVFHLDTRNIESVTIDLFPIDLETYFRKYQSRKNIAQLDLDLIDPWKSFEIEVENYSRYRQCSQEIELPVEGSGTWAVVVSADRFRATTLVVRTDLDVIVQAGRKEVLIYAQDMLNDTPAEEVRILVATPGPDNQPVIREVVTGTDGSVLISYEDLVRDDDVRVMAIRNEDTAVTGLNLRRTVVATGLTPFGRILMDKATYRPGDKIHWHAAVREVEDGRWQNPAGQTGKMSLFSPDGTMIYQEEFVYRSAGTTDGEFLLPPAAPFGDWKVQITSKGKASHTQSFMVDETAPLAAQLKIETDKTVYVRGEKILLTVDARTWYGEPLSGALVNIEVPNSSDQFFQQLTIDENGQGSVTIDTRTTQQNQISVTAILVTEGIGKEISIPVRQRIWEISLDVPRLNGQYLRDESAPLQISTRDLSGSPIERDLEIRLVKRLRQQDRWAEKTISEFSLKTDSDGKGELRIPLNESGNLRIIAEGEDRLGNRISEEISLRVSDDEDSRGLIWLLEDSSIVSGETKSLRINLNGESGPALLTILGDRLVEHRIVELNKGTNQLEFTADNSIRNKATIRLARMDTNGLHTADAFFKIKRELKISVTRTPERIPLPGEEIELEIYTTDLLGKPVPAEIAMSVLDSAVDDLYPNWFPSLSQTGNFNHDPARLMSLSSSCEFNYAGVTTEISQDILDEELREIELGAMGEVFNSLTIAEGLPNLEMEPSGRGIPQRKMVSRDAQAPGQDMGLILAGQASGEYGFRRGRGALGNESGSENPETQRENYLAYWSGSLQTGIDGKTSITIKVPERNTQWRARIRGLTENDLFGEAKEEFISKDVFIIESMIPKRAMEGDTISPRIRLFNDLGSESIAKLKISIPMKDGVEEIEKSFALLPGIQEVILDPIPPLGPTPVVPYTVSIEIGNLEFSQQGSISVNRRGLESIVSENILIDSGSIVRSLKLPGADSAQDRNLSITLGSSLDSNLVYLASGTSSFIEPRRSHDNSTTAAQLLGLSELLGRVSNSSLQSESGLIESIRNKVRGLVSELVMNQFREGGWAWAKSNSKNSRLISNEVTAEVLEALAVAQKSGFIVPSSVFSKAVPYLEAQFRSTNQGQQDLKSVFLSALVACDAGDFGSVNRLHRNRDQLTNYGLAALARSLSRLDKAAMARDVSQSLLNRRNADGSWNAQPKSNSHSSLCGDSRYITAICLYSLAVSSTSSTELETSAKWIQNKLPMYLDRASSASIAALAQYQGDSSPADKNCEVIIFVNGESTGSLQLSGDQSQQAVNYYLGDGPSAIDVQLKVTGDFGSHAIIEFTGKNSDYPNIEDEYFRIQRVDYLSMSPRMDGMQLDSGFDILKKSDTLWKNRARNISIGEQAEYQLTIKGKPKFLQREYLRVDIQIPAGVHIDTNSIKGNFSSHDIRGKRLSIWSPFLNSLNINFSVIGSCPGTYFIPPPIIRSVTEPGRTTVGKAMTLKVRLPEEEDTDVYKATPDEIYDIGTRHWKADRWRDARSTLQNLWDDHSSELRNKVAKNVARILMLAAVEAGDNSAMVSYFEILKESDPQLSLSLDNFIRIGEAYRTLGESARSLQIFMAVIETTFSRDLKVSDVLANNDPGPAMNLLIRLTMENPPIPVVLAAEQKLADMALKFGSMDNPSQRKKGLDIVQMALLGRNTLDRFLILYGNDPTAPDAGLNLVSALIDQRNWKLATKVASVLAEKYTEPRYFDSFRYTGAVALWAMGDDEKAQNLLEEIAEAKYVTSSGGTRPSENRDLATFIIGQIHHAANDPANAARYYEKVKDLFTDARESLRQLNARELDLNEISEFRPGQPVKIELRYRNIDSAEVLAYKVNLMTLALREQDLSRVTEVNLSGISPTLSRTVSLGEQGAAGGTLHAKQSVEIPIEDVGAYLIIVRGGDVHTSGLILVNQMQMVVNNVDEDLRIQIVDPLTDELLPDVQIRVMSATNNGVISGTTDRRGLFFSAGSQWGSTVIARRDQGDYAFFRSKVRDPRQPFPGKRQGQNDARQQLQLNDYLDNVIQFNGSNIDARDRAWRSQVDNAKDGIQIFQATD